MNSQLHFTIKSSTAALTVALLAAAAAQGQNASWVNPSGGSYETTSNWIPKSVPPPSSNIIFGLANTYTIDFPSDQTATDLLVANGVDLTFAASGPGGTARNYHLTGDASIENSSLTLGDLTQGQLLNMEVGGKLDMQGGKLNLINGAQLTSQTSLANSNIIEGAGGVDGRIVVSGADAAGQPSRWQSVGGTDLGGSGGPAGMSILGGGKVSSAGTFSVGAEVMADGSALEIRGTTATGDPSSLTSNAFRLGFVGTSGGLSKGTVQVAAGGFLSTDAADVRNDSLVVIDGEDANQNPSRWQAGSISVAGGFVDVVDGGYLSSDFVNLSRLAIARINGVGANGRPSQWEVNGNIRLGASNGFGSLLIDSGLVTSDTAEIGTGSGDSLFSVDGNSGANGVWENSGDVSVGGSLTGPETNGDLRLVNEHSRINIGGTLTIWGPGSVKMHGGELLVDVVDHTHGGTFGFDAGRLAVNRFDGDLHNLAGILTPGVDDETGATLVVGDYTQQSTGTLAFDLGGAGPGSTYDLVNITGDAQIDGQLELSLLGGFSPDATDEFTVLAAESLIGLFDNVSTGQRLDTIDGRGSFVVNYGIGSEFDESRIVLSDFQSLSTLAGDFDFDGDVDSLDFLVWQRDPSVGSLVDWQSNYSLTAQPSTAANTVPEPAALVLVACGVCVWLGSQRMNQVHPYNAHGIQLDKVFQPFRVSPSLPNGRVAIPTICRQILLLLTVLVSNFGAMQVVRAQGTHVWNNPTGGVYGLFSNWTPQGIPSQLDTARFALSEEYTVSFNQSQQAGKLEVPFGDVTFRGSGISPGDRTYTPNNTNVDDFGKLTLVHNPTGDHSFHLNTTVLNVGGEVFISDGTKVTGSTALLDGFDQNTPGIVRVSGIHNGQSSIWEAEAVFIGSSASGLLIVEEGGFATIEDLFVGEGDGSYGEARVVGVGSDGRPSTLTVDELDIGVDGNGLLTVSGGAEVNVAGSTVIGFFDAGELFLSGDNAAPRPSRLTTENFGIFIGTATIENRAELIAGQVHISSSSLVARDPGAILQANVELRIASSSATIENGAELSTAQTIISSSGGALASRFLKLQTDNASTIPTWANAGDVFIGGNSENATETAQLSIQGGIAEIGGTVKIWDEGVVLLSTLTSTEEVPTTLVADTIENTLGGEFDFQVGTLAVQQFEGNLINQGGTLAPGNDTAGATFVIGNYEQQIDATLALDIGGTAAGVSHDLLTITGLAEIRGELQLYLTEGFTPEYTDHFDVGAATSLVGFFDNVLNGQRIDTMDGRGSFVVNYGVGSDFAATKIVLSDFVAASFMAGDFDFDGDVDGMDFLLWQRNDGSAEGLAAWQSNYGSGNALLLASTSVPEPTTYFLATMATVTFLLIRSTKFHSRKNPTKFNLCSGVVASIVLLPLNLAPTTAATKDWSPLGTSRNWHDSANWSPVGIPADSDQVVIDNCLRPVELQFGDSNVVNSLYLNNGGRLFTGSYMLVVHEPTRGGPLAVEGTGSKLIVEPDSVQGRDVDTDELEIRDGGEMELAGGIVHVDQFMQVEPAGRVTGHGFILLNDSDSANQPKVLQLHGTLQPIGGEMRLEASEDGVINMGSETIFASLDANFGDLTIDATLGDRFHGVVTVGAGRTVTWERIFETLDTAVVNLFGGDASQPATLHTEESRLLGRLNVSNTGVLSGTNALYPDSEIELPEPEDYLILRGTTAVFGDVFNSESPGAIFTGRGVIENDTSAKAVFVTGPNVDLKFVDSGIVDLVTVSGFAALEVGVGHFNDFLRQATGQLSFDIGEVDGTLIADSHEFTGSVELNGRLQVELVDLLTLGLPELVAGDSYEILSAARGVTGKLNSVALPLTPVGTAWRIEYNADSVRLDLIAGNSLAGDFDVDGDVDAADSIVWQRAHGTAVELGQWQSNFGSIASLRAEVRHVPEPRFAAVFCTASAEICFLRRS